MIKHEKVAILLVTMDNREYAQRCLESLLVNTAGVPYHVHLVNNGIPGSCAWATDDRVSVWEHGEDTSWTGGLVEGARHTDAPYLLFLNDDTVFGPAFGWWLAALCGYMHEPRVGAVGPSSNLVSGPQSIMDVFAPMTYRARYLISFCCLVRREALEAVGGFDPSMTDADDIDYSIRLRQGGWHLVGARGVYVYHHGFVTGNRLHGNRWAPGGYNSREWSARNWNLLVNRHGLEAVQEVYMPGTLGPYAPFASSVS